MVPATTWARIASRPSLVAYTSVIPVYRLDVSLEYTLDEKRLPALNRKLRCGRR